MLNNRGNLKEAKENIEKSISLIDKTIGNMPISNRYSLFQKEGNFHVDSLPDLNSPIFMLSFIRRSLSLGLVLNLNTLPDEDLYSMSS